jgi:hypothetical protein
VNGAIVQFYGFSDSHGTQHRLITRPPDYILVKVLEGPATDISILGLPQGVFPLKPETFKVKIKGEDPVKLTQFPISLAYAITDFKCQGSTYKDGIICDLQKPSGNAPTASPYVQLSRATSLDRVFILRPFDEKELCVAVSCATIRLMELFVGLG